MTERTTASASHAFRWHARSRRREISLPQAFVVKEEKSLVLLDRPSNCPPKVVPLERRDWVAELVREPVIRVHYGIAEKLVNAAMELIAARARDNVYHRSARKSKFGGEVGLLNFEFLHRIHRGHIGNVLNSAVLLEVRCACAVDENVSRGVSSAVRIEIDTAIRILRVVQVRLGDSRRKERKIREVPVHQRKVVHEFSIYNLPCDRVFRLQVDRTCSYLDRLRRRTNLQDEIDGNVLAYVQLNRIFSLGLKTGGLCSQVVCSGGNLSENKSAFRINCYRVREPLVHVHQRQFCRRDRSSRVTT